MSQLLFAVKAFLHSFSLDCEINEHKHFHFLCRHNSTYFWKWLKNLLFHVRCYLSVWFACSSPCLCAKLLLQAAPATHTSPHSLCPQQFFKHHFNKKWRMKLYNIITILWHWQYHFNIVQSNTILKWYLTNPQPLGCGPALGCGPFGNSPQRKNKLLKIICIFFFKYSFLCIVFRQIAPQKWPAPDACL